MTTHTISSCLRMSPALLAGLRGKMRVIVERRAFFTRHLDPSLQRNCRQTRFGAG